MTGINQIPIHAGGIQNPYQEFTVTVPANGLSDPIRYNFDFFRVMAVSGAGDIANARVIFGGSGNPTPFTGAGIGLKLPFVIPFVQFQNTGAGDLTLTIALAIGDIRDDRLNVSGNISVVNASGDTLDVSDAAAQALLTTIDADTGSMDTTLTAMLADTAAMDTNLAAIATDTGNMDTSLNAIEADVDLLNDINTDTNAIWSVLLTIKSILQSDTDQFRGNTLIDSANCSFSQVTNATTQVVSAAANTNGVIIRYGNIATLNGGNGYGGIAIGGSSNYIAYIDGNTHQCDVRDIFVAAGNSIHSVSQNAYAIVTLCYEVL